MAFRILYERHARGIYLLAYRLLGREGANDVVQDVFMTVWQKAHQFDEERAAFGTWLNAIARHRILDLAGRRTREERLSVAWDVAEQIDHLVAGSDDVAEKVGSGAKSAAVLQALGTLPPLQRRVLVLVYFGGYTHRELAELLDWPLGTVKKRIRLGLEKLADQLGHLRPESFAAAEEASHEL